MKVNEFIRAEIEWAKSILAKPEYVMPNGRQSHQVAYSVINKAMDQAIDKCRFTIDGCIY